MTSLQPCPYKVLGVSKDAQLSEIRTAYRKLVLKCHPDKVQDPALKAAKQDEFQRVQQAYELLGSEEERSKYDDQIKLMELQQKRRNVEANTSAAHEDIYSRS
ncbi:DnaJ subfamily C member 16 like protein [Verticillium longisporum]|nr:DnaJ subfamily C member 16 like protein [Verticillium longisporum]